MLDTPGHSERHTNFMDALTPGAREILPLEASREEWLAARRRGIGGSDASTLMGFNPYSSLLNLWLDKTGRGEEQADTALMRRGRWLEPVIREYVAEETELTIAQTGLLQSLEQPLALVTPDGIASDGGVVEIKTATWRKAAEWSDDQVADHAELQAQHAMFVTGLNHAWVAVSIDGMFPIIRRVERDEIIIGALLNEIEFFWNTYVVPDEAPPLSGNRSEVDAVRTMWPVHEQGKTVALTPELLRLLEDWNEAKATEREAKAAAAALDTRIKSLVGDAEYVMPAGWTPDAGEERPLATARANGQFSEKRFREQEPELAEQFTVTREAEVLDLDELRKRKPDVHTRYRARVLRTTTAFDNYRGA
jgi:putative phage-type endonuclease